MSEEETERIINIIENDKETNKLIEDEYINENDDERKKLPTYCTVPIFNSKREYGFLRDITIFFFGGILLFPSIFYYTNWEMKWLFLFSSGIIIFVISRLIVYIVLNFFLYIFLRCNNLKVYYYTIAWNGNLTLIIWSLGMTLITNLYVTDLNLNISFININIPHITQIFISLIVIGISNAIRIIILDFIFEMPSYKNFKNEIIFFLKISNGIKKLFGVYKKKIKLILKKNYQKLLNFHYYQQIFQVINKKY